MGRPFLNTARAVIYASAAKISFIIKRKKETFYFKNKTSQFLGQPQYEPRKRTNRRNKQNKNKKQVRTESAKMVTAIHNGQDHQLKSPHLIKKDDPGVPTIECTINRCSFQKAVCDTGSGVNLMAKLTYEFMYRTMPLYPTYTQLQMGDQTYRIVEAIAKEVPVQIDDHFIPIDFLVIDMEEDDYDPPIILGRPFLSITKAIIYIGIGEVHLHFPFEKVPRHFNDNYIVDGSKQNRTRRRRCYHNQKKQNTKDGWADYEGEVSRTQNTNINIPQHKYGRRKRS